MIKGFIDYLSRGRAAPTEGASGFTAADQRAFRADLAEVDAVERGLGEAIARFILTGEGETVLLELDAILGAADDRANLLSARLHAS